MRQHNHVHFSAGVGDEDRHGQVINPYEDVQSPATKRVKIDAPADFPSKAKSTARQDDEVVLEMGIERFSVPEVLFNPEMIGMDQCGVGAAIRKCAVIRLCNQSERAALITLLSTLPSMESRLQGNLTSTCGFGSTGNSRIYECTNVRTYGYDTGCVRNSVPEVRGNLEQQHGSNRVIQSDALVLYVCTRECV